PAPGASTRGFRGEGRADGRPPCRPLDADGGKGERVATRAWSPTGDEEGDRRHRLLVHQGEGERVEDESRERGRRAPRALVVRAANGVERLRQQRARPAHDVAALRL